MIIDSSDSDSDSDSDIQVLPDDNVFLYTECFNRCILYRSQIVASTTGSLKLLPVCLMARRINLLQKHSSPRQ